MWRKAILLTKHWNYWTMMARNGLRHLETSQQMDHGMTSFTMNSVALAAAGNFAFQWKPTMAKVGLGHRATFNKSPKFVPALGASTGRAKARRLALR